MNVIEYGQWYYLIYLVPGATAILTLMLSMIGGGRHHRGGSHQQQHVGAHHTHAGGHHTAGHPHHPGPHSHIHHASSNRTAAVQPRLGISEQMLTLIGFGKIPTPFVWGSLLLGWSVFGFWSTRLLEGWMKYPALFALPSIAIAVVGAVGMSRLTSTFLGRMLPQDESLVTSTIDLCGLIGKVAFPVDTSRGRVHVYDDHGTMHDCSARTAPGQGVIGLDKSVLVIDYDPKQDQLIVEESV